MRCGSADSHDLIRDNLECQAWTGERWFDPFRPRIHHEEGEGSQLYLEKKQAAKQKK